MDYRLIMLKLAIIVIGKLVSRYTKFSKNTLFHYHFEAD